ncbi:hypothetical protein ACQ859_10975 [Roseateles chitinivorans]|uniref:hypothetical protein n=1 Tax=Roseateles chitinivorans TaxID=2917965 RepID=UPI003D67DBBF
MEELQLTKILLILASAAVPPAFAFAGMVLILVANPNADIETEGWVLGWTGMGTGFAAGLLTVWAFWRAR